MAALPPPLQACLIRDLAPLSLRRSQCHLPMRSSPFRQQQRRLQTIPPRPPPSPQPTFPQYAGQPPPPSAKPRRRWGRAIIYSALFSIAGGQLAAYGIKVSGLMTPMHEPGSPEDEAALAALEREMQRLDIVKQFGIRDGSAVEGQQAMPFQGQQLPFVEIATRPDAHHEGAQHDSPIPSTLDPPHAILADATELSSTLLRGSRGLGIQKAYYNPTTNDLYALVYFGPALAGWPSITHGGAIATVMEESMARCAGLVQRNEGRASSMVPSSNEGQVSAIATSNSGRKTPIATTGNAEGQDLGQRLAHREPESIQFRYFKPTLTQRLYILHVVPLEVVTEGTEPAQHATRSSQNLMQGLEKVGAGTGILEEGSKQKRAVIDDSTNRKRWAMENGSVKISATLIDAKSEKTMCTATGTWRPA